MVHDIFDELKRMRDEMDHIFVSYFNEPGKRLTQDIDKKTQQLMTRKPLSDIVETDTEVIASIELPGINKNDIQLNVTDYSLEISTKTKQETEVKNKGFFKQERRYSNFQRVLPLPAQVEPEKVTAKMENGLLTITMLKLKKLESKKIDIE